MRDEQSAKGAIDMESDGSEIDEMEGKQGSERVCLRLPALGRPCVCYGEVGIKRSAHIYIYIYIYISIYMCIRQWKWECLLRLSYAFRDYYAVTSRLNKSSGRRIIHVHTCA
ncbi:hypothetical protein SDJN03_02001, partial [Cucurbita argyrosperma subsp. sororia]